MGLICSWRSISHGNVSVIYLSSDDKNFSIDEKIFDNIITDEFSSIIVPYQDNTTFNSWIEKITESDQYKNSFVMSVQNKELLLFGLSQTITLCADQFKEMKNFSTTEIQPNFTPIQVCIDMNHLLCRDYLNI